MLGYETVLGDPTLQQNVAFTCISNVCRPKEATTLGLFINLQNSINLAAAVIGLPPYLKLDGAIGLITARKVQAIAAKVRDYIPREQIAAKAGIQVGELTQALDLAIPEMVAKYAVPLTQMMTVIGTSGDPAAQARAAEYQANAQLVTPATAQATSQIAPTGTGPQTAPSTPTGTSRTPLIIGGVAAAAGIVILGIVLVMTRKRSPRHRR